MIEGKNKYDHIEIPEKLNLVYDTACLRAKRRKRIRLAKKMGTAAAAFACAFVLANNSTVYARASNLPILGTVVQLLHVGEGGEVTDGVKGSLEAADDTLLVAFQAAQDERAPYYEIQYHTMPRRITVVIYGVREFDRAGLKENAMQCTGVKDFYMQTVLDDSQIKFTVELKPGFGWQAAEYENPGLLSFKFGTNYYKADEMKDAWVLRIPSMDDGEPLAMIQELYAGYAMEHEDAAIKPEEMTAVKTKEGLFTMVAGSFPSEEEAKKAAEMLNQIGFSHTVWYAEKLGVNENPE